MKREEKGSVTMIVLVTVFFIVIILSSFFIYTSSRRRAQLEETQIIANSYETAPVHSVLELFCFESADAAIRNFCNENRR